MDELAGSESQHDSLASSQPHSNSTIKHGLEAYYEEEGKLVGDIVSDSYSQYLDERNQLLGNWVPGPEFEGLQRDLMPDMQDSSQDQQSDPVLQSFLQRALRDKESLSNSITSSEAVNDDIGIHPLDSDCAICGLPDIENCECEARALSPESEMEWPESIRSYVQRSFVPFHENEETTVPRADVEAKLKNTITTAKENGTLYTLDWDNMPLPQALIMAERDVDNKQT
ncbi:Ff.00g084830.m01.CDS01 [Fusarium sp. VM40]|nr:Ff.00g084830.m01.CDS01 [Fusarium sp. VM40]